MRTSPQSFAALIKYLTSKMQDCTPWSVTAVTLASVFREHDAVISTLGGRLPTRAATSKHDRSAKAIVEAASATDLKRVLVTSTALLFADQTLLCRNFG